MVKNDVVIIKPGSQKQLYGELSAFDYTAIEPPLWPALLAGFLRNTDFSVVLYDAEVEEWNYQQAAEAVADANPMLAIVVVSGSNPSASTMNMTGAANILSCLKDIQPGIRTLVTGLHPSALPERTLNEVEVDFVCQGEGFFAIQNLVEALKSNLDDFEISGIWRKENGIVIPSIFPPLLKDINELPMPAWDLLPMEKYRAHNWHCFDDISNRQPYGLLYTSLGCPFRCSFCCINSMFGKNTIRYRKIDNVIQEIDVLVNTYGIKNIKIIDEMFGLNEKRVIELCERIIERGYGLNMWAYARVNTVTEKMLEKMKAAGINWISYGFESGNSNVIADVSKGYQMDMVEKVVKMTYAHDIHICANFIFGLPEDDYETMNQTLKLMLDINAEWVNIWTAMAFPGSKLYDMALEKGWPLPETWEGYSQYSRNSQPLSTNYLTGAQVLSFRDYAFDAYYKNPRYLSMINEKFGKKTMNHIISMSGKKLERNFSNI